MCFWGLYYIRAQRDIHNFEGTKGHCYFAGGTRVDYNLGGHIGRVITMEGTKGEVSLFEGHKVEIITVWGM